MALGAPMSSDEELAGGYEWPPASVGEGRDREEVRCCLSVGMMAGEEWEGRGGDCRERAERFDPSTRGRFCRRRWGLSSIGECCWSVSLVDYEGSWRGSKT